MRKLQLFAFAALTLSQHVHAQSSPPGGGQLQQIPPAPAQERPAPTIRIEQGTPPPGPAADQSRILVNSLRVIHARVYSEAELIAVSGFQPQSELSLSDMNGLAARITDHYRRNGYFVARAYLPAQEISDGVVTLRVLEGEYGKVRLQNQSTLSDSLPDGILEGIEPGDPIAIAPLENRLLLLSDIPGVNVKSTLVPGSTPGTSDLIVDVLPGRSISGNVEADNAGNRYTGEYRVGGTVYFNNPTGHGDVLSLRVLTSGQGLKYGRVAYQTQFGKATVGVGYTAVNYRLGEEFESLGAHGTVRIGSIFGSYPLIRSRNSNLYAIAGYDAKTFQDRIDATSSVTDKKIGVWTIGLHGNVRDNLFGGGISTYAVALHAGEVDIITPSALAADAATARTNGSFNRVSFSAARLQSITSSLSFYASINGQLASKNLDVSEKLGLGGMYGVRAYPQGEGYGDEGYIVNLELRQRLPKFSENMPGQVHLVGFVDTGEVKINKNPWVAGDNDRRLSGAGVGLTWEEYDNFAVRAYYARKLGNAASTSAPDRSGRFWAQVVKYF